MWFWLITCVFQSSHENDNAIFSYTVLSVYLHKHISSLRNFFKDGKEHSEPIEGRVSDIINYLLLMLAMREKYKHKGIQDDPEC